MRRLAFIKHLFTQAVSHSYMPAPLKSTSLLLFHDSVELFLQLASEYVDSGARQPNFLDYWELIGAKLESGSPSQKESMRRLNKARVSLKHHGTFPSDLDIEAFRATTVSFFEENTPLVFGIEFSEVSLIEYVTPAVSRDLLKEAQSLAETNPVDAIAKAGIAYEEMIRYHEARESHGTRTSPLYFGPDFKSFAAFRSELTSLDRGLERFVDSVKDSIDLMQGAMRAMVMGVDYRRYMRFKTQLPGLFKPLGRSDWVVIQDANRLEANPPTPADATFCIDFVLESALVLAEFERTSPVQGARA